MREEHTPGPWKADRGVDDDPTRCYVVQDIPAGRPFVIAEVANGAPGDCLDTEVANARLIAAAPDMLDVLRQVEQLITRDSDDLGFHLKVVPMRVETVKALRAAIAKAEGS